jgi:LuxR family maltose regulon positive regulatory protein
MLMGQKVEIDDLDYLRHYSVSPGSWKGNTFLLSSVFFQEIQDLTHAWVLLQNNQFEQAIQLLQGLLVNAENSHLDDFAIQYAILLAMAFHKINRHSEALKYIGLALRKAKQENQKRVFLEQGQDIINLLYDAVQNHIEEEFAGKVLTLFPQLDSNAQKSKLFEFNGEIIEALTAREAEIIALIAQGLSNQEIAYHLHLSLSTIKVHIYNIFRKLNVHNRTQAVAKAQALSIIP